MSEQKFELPKGWATITLQQCVDILDGKRIPINDKERKKRKGKIPYYGANGQVGWIDDFIFDEELLLVSEDGAPFLDLTKNTSYIILGKSWVNNHAHVIRAVKELTSNQFLCHYLNIFDYHGFVSEPPRMKLNQSSLKKIPVTLPPFNEQKRIVSKIKELFSKIDSTKQSLEHIKLQLIQYKYSLLKSAFEGKLTEVWRKRNNLESLDEILNTIDNDCRNSKFTLEKENQLIIPKTWKILKIARPLIFLGSGITPKGGQTNYQESGIPFIRSQNVYSDGLHLENIVYVSKELHQKMSRTHTKDKDVLLNITGASIGRSCIIPENFGSANVNQHVCILRFHKKINTLFFSYWLNSPVFQELISSIQEGETRQALNFGQIKNMVFPLCSLEEQEQIVSQIEHDFSLVENTQQIVNSTLQQLKIMKMSILKQAFEGKLVPQDPNDEPASVLLERIQKEKLKIRQ